MLGYQSETMRCQIISLSRSSGLSLLTLADLAHSEDIAVVGSGLLQVLPVRIDQLLRLLVHCNMRRSTSLSLLWLAQVLLRCGLGIWCVQFTLIPRDEWFDHSVRGGASYTVIVQALLFHHVFIVVK